MFVSRSKPRHARPKGEGGRHALPPKPSRGRWPKTLLATLVIAVMTTVSAVAHEVYTVKKGDTLSQIAAANGTTWQELHALNKDINNPDLIFPGQKIVLSVDGPTAKPSKPKAAKPKAESKPTKGKVRPATGSITSKYGMRTHPITGVHKLHSGTDFAYGDGVARAAKAGKVTQAGWNGAYGKMVTIDHGGGTVTRYAHLDMTSTKVGRHVEAGQKIGDIGSTGSSTGPHLHFEVLKDGNFVNPMSWLG